MLKSIQKLMSKYGINALADDTPFLQRRHLVRVDALTCQLPFCFVRRIEALKPGRSLWCYTVTNPAKKEKLALFLVDQSKEIVDQVYYPRDYRGIQTCKKIQQYLASSLASIERDNYCLAA